MFLVSGESLAFNARRFKPWAHQLTATFSPCRLHQPCDMPDDMLRHAIDVSRKELGSLTDWQKEADGAVQKIKDVFDSTYGPSWHVVVGKHFGSRVTHDSKNFVFFYLEDKAVLIFKCG